MQQIKYLNIQVATILSNNTSLVYRQCVQHGVVFVAISRAQMQLPIGNDRCNCFCRIVQHLHVPTWFLSAADWLCITFWRTGIIFPSVRISRRQISCQETYFIRVASASLLSYHQLRTQALYPALSNSVEERPRFRLVTWSSNLLGIGGGVIQRKSTYLTYFLFRN